jgi:hypothetical protein
MEWWVWQGRVHFFNRCVMSKKGPFQCEQRHCRVYLNCSMMINHGIQVNMWTCDTYSKWNLLRTQCSYDTLLSNQLIFEWSHWYAVNNWCINSTYFLRAHNRMHRCTAARCIMHPTSCHPYPHPHPLSNQPRCIEPIGHDTNHTIKLSISIEENNKPHDDWFHTSTTNNQENNKRLHSLSNNWYSLNDFDEYSTILSKFIRCKV